MLKLFKHINNSLTALRQNRQISGKRGFTIVELLVVIVVIVILSLIVITLYDNIAVQANDSSLKSDVKNAADQLKLGTLRGGQYPATAAEVNNGAGFKTSEGNTITYMRKPYGYCVYGSNPDATTTYMMRSLDGVLKEGDCSMEMSLFAGSGTDTGYIDDPVGTTARINTVYDNGITSSSDGDLYLTDYNNYRVRKVSSTTAVTTHAGSGGTGCTTGTEATAELGFTNGIAYDNNTDTTYFMACNGSRLYKRTSAGTVSVLSGGGATTTCNTASGAATSLNAKGLLMGGDGNLYVIASGMHKVCKINKITGAASLVAGSSSGSTEGTGAAARFNNPWDATMDSKGNLFVVDRGNNKIRKVTPGGEVSTFAGSGSSGATDGVGTAASFNAPRGIAIDRYDTMYVSSGSYIRIITSDQTVTTLRTASGQTALSWPGGSFAGGLTMDTKGILYGLTNRGVVKIII